MLTFVTALTFPNWQLLDKCYIGSWLLGNKLKLVNWSIIWYNQCLFVESYLDWPVQVDDQLQLITFIGILSILYRLVGRCELLNICRTPISDPHNQCVPNTPQQIKRRDQLSGEYEVWYQQEQCPDPSAGHSGPCTRVLTTPVLILNEYIHCTKYIE